MSIAHYKECIKAGLKLIPLNGKAPFYKDWQNETEANRVTDPEDGRLYAHDMGWQIPRGMAVLDVDKTELFDFTAVEGCTAAQRTASGGMHYLCQIPDNVSVDFRHPWGEILQHPRQVRIYQLSDDWLRGEIEPLPQVFWGNSTNGNGSTGFTMSVPTDLTTLPDVGNRNNWLTAKAGELWNQKGVHAIKDIYALAKELGLDEKEADGIVGQLPKWERTESEDFAPEPTGAFIHAPTLAKMELPRMEFWRGPYGPSQNVLIYGPAGAGKSLYMLDEMSRLDVPVCIVDGEMTLQLLQRRIGEGPENIYFHHGSQPNEFMNTDYSKFKVVVLDTLAANYETKHSENEMEHWKVLNHWLKKQADEGFCTVCVHHQGKDKTQGARGSSELNRVFDTTLSINKYDDLYAVQQHKDRHCLQLGRTDYTIDPGEGGILRFFKE